MRLLEGAPVIVFLLIATAVEVSGDAVIRRALEDHAGLARLGLIAAGGLFLLAYGVTINLAPVSFARVAGLYVRRCS